jgi:phosphosulfolactate synthase
MLKLPTRTGKPRTTGLTSIHDVSLTCASLKGILADYSDFVDIAKFGIGTAYIAPNLREKIELYRSYQVLPYFGGTLFEKFVHQNKLDAYLDFLRSHQITAIEVSAGITDTSLDDRVRVIEQVRDEFTVLAEVGSKDSERIMNPSSWIAEIKTLMEAGAAYVITEGRDSGTAGIFRPSGELRTGLIGDIIQQFGVSRIIFEAPTPASQMHFIKVAGSNVNLGNINPQSLLLLETQRVGLRSETFHVE